MPREIISKEPSMHIGKPFAQLSQSGDYMNVVCMKCGDGCETDLVSNVHVPILKITCKNCGVLGESKLGPIARGFSKKGLKSFPNVS